MQKIKKTILPVIMAFLLAFTGLFSFLSIKKENTLSAKAASNSYSWWGKYNQFYTFSDLKYPITDSTTFTYGSNMMYSIRSFRPSVLRNLVNQHDVDKLFYSFDYETIEGHACTYPNEDGRDRETLIIFEFITELPDLRYMCYLFRELKQLNFSVALISYLDKDTLASEIYEYNDFERVIDFYKQTELNEIFEPTAVTAFVDYMFADNVAPNLENATFIIDKAFIGCARLSEGYPVSELVSELDKGIEYLYYQSTFLQRLISLILTEFVAHGEAIDIRDYEYLLNEEDLQTAIEALKSYNIKILVSLNSDNNPYSTTWNSFYNLLPRGEDRIISVEVYNYQQDIDYGKLFEAFPGYVFAAYYSSGLRKSLNDYFCLLQAKIEERYEDRFKCYILQITDMPLGENNLNMDLYDEIADKMNTEELLNELLEEIEAYGGYN